MAFEKDLMAVDGGRCDMCGGACQDCVVTVLAPRSTAGHLDAEELRALSVLADAGMIPPMRPDAAPGRSPKTASVPRTWAFPATKAS
jgi:hypothetical protein